jgi:hypothetical protein
MDIQIPASPSEKSTKVGGKSASFTPHMNYHQACTAVAVTIWFSSLSTDNMANILKEETFSALTQMSHG